MPTAESGCGHFTPARKMNLRDHDIYQRFCDQAGKGHVSPQEEAKRVITARALEDTTPQIVPKQAFFFATFVGI
jgi:hypothetical protein